MVARGTFIILHAHDFVLCGCFMTRQIRTEQQFITDIFSLTFALLLFTLLRCSSIEECFIANIH